MSSPPSPFSPPDPSDLSRRQAEVERKVAEIERRRKALEEQQAAIRQQQEAARAEQERREQEQRQQQEERERRSREEQERRRAQELQAEQRRRDEDRRREADERARLDREQRLSEQEAELAKQEAELAKQEAELARQQAEVAAQNSAPEPDGSSSASKVAVASVAVGAAVATVGAVAARNPPEPLLTLSERILSAGDLLEDRNLMGLRALTAQAASEQPSNLQQLLLAEASYAQSNLASDPQEAQMLRNQAAAGYENGLAPGGGFSLDPQIWATAMKHYADTLRLSADNAAPTAQKDMLLKSAALYGYLEEHIRDPQEMPNLAASGQNGYGIAMMKLAEMDGDPGQRKAFAAAADQAFGKAASILEARIEAGAEPDAEAQRSLSIVQRNNRELNLVMETLDADEQEAHLEASKQQDYSPSDYSPEPSQSPAP